ncbi:MULTISPECIES: DUF1127 domain-containing protein [Tabrizicola]|uniref:DUF1127 domain-containing protein n=1 Tax=Tabrizicola TaxID=1443919 RepID=UPI001080CC21|nr:MULTISPECIES: DUF1127 domain-containing protein [Paracoccaceae]
MTLVLPSRARTSRLRSLRQIIAAFRRQIRIRSETAHLDDHLRADIGLPPLAERPLEPHEVAARLFLMAAR